MADHEYIKRLQRHLADYKSNVLLVQESGHWGAPPRPYPHILPVERRELNIVAPFREAFWRAQRQRAWKLHKYFHHLSSSQALAFNVLFLLYPDVPSEMLPTRRLLGLPEMRAVASSSRLFSTRLRARTLMLWFGRKKERERSSRSNSLSERSAELRLMNGI